MGIYPPSLQRLIDQFTRLPGIGQKSAARMALFVMRSRSDLAEGLARSLMEVKEKIRLCSTCFNLTDEDPCAICRDPRREDGTLCVVETPDDQLALEAAGIFKGRYHILHGNLSPLDGVGPGDLRVSELLRRLDGGSVREIIIATNPTLEGETTAAFLRKVLSEKNGDLTISRIALGVPMGGSLTYMDRMTLEHALKRRTPMKT